MDHSRDLRAFGMGPQLGDGMLHGSSVLQGMVYAATKSDRGHGKRHEDSEQWQKWEIQGIKYTEGKGRESTRETPRAPPTTRADGWEGEGLVIEETPFSPTGSVNDPNYRNGSSRNIEDDVTGSGRSNSLVLGRPPRWVGNDKSRRVKSKIPGRPASITRSHNKENGGGSKSRGTSRKALETAIADAARSGWRQRVREEFTKKFYASSPWASKSTKRKRMEQIASQCGYPIAPVSSETMIEMAAILDEAKIQSADQYLAEAKWAHIEEGHRWDEALERKFTMCKRALKRDNGPEKRAQEVKLEELSTDTWAMVSDKKSEPRRIAWICAWTVIWMLRSIEVVNVKTKERKDDQTHHPQVENGPGSQGPGQDTWMLW